jgi:hypothetical protein
LVTPALGTPASGVVTNLTGTASININGTVGATAANTGAFTTLTTSSTVTLNGGTANGVAFLDGSKVLTSGSALTFDGTRLGIGSAGNTEGMLTVGTGTVTDKNGIVLLRGAASSVSTTQVAIFNEINGIGSGESLTLRSPAGFKFQNNDGTSEQMRLTSTGLGIGTSSPSSAFSGSARVSMVAATGSTAASSRVSSANASAELYSAGGATEWGLYSASNSAFKLWTNNAVAMTVDSSGNLGLGVTPNTWTGTGVKAFQFQNGALAASNTFGTALSFNAYYDNGWKYVTTGATAGRYLIEGNSHNWSVAASGTAGNAISFTQAMTLDASGKLLLGTTAGGGELSFKDVTGLKIQFNSNAANFYGISKLAGGGGLGDGEFKFTAGDTSAGGFTFSSGGSERARIDSSGNLLVGTTTQISDSNRLEVQGTNGIGIKCTGTSGNACELQWHSATSGDNTFIGFYTETSITQRGSITYNRAGGLVAYNVTSDYRAKDISGPVTNSGALIDSIPVYMGKMHGATQERPMFIAHEVPAYAHTGEKDAVDADGKPVYQQMDASALIPVMWAEIQSLRARLAAAGI